MQFEQHALSNLANFGDRALLSVLDRLEAEELAGARTDQEYSLAEVLECILWLDLGVELRFFEPHGSQRLCSATLLPELLQRCDAFLRRWPDLFSSGGLPVFRGSLSEGISYAEPSGRYRNPWNLQSTFQHVLFMAQRLAADPHVRLLTKTLCFVQESTWLEIISESATESEIENAFVSHPKTKPNKPDLLVGTVHALEYIRTTGDYVGELLLSDAHNDSELQQFIRDSSRIQVWRLNLWLSSIEGRFESLIDDLIESTGIRWQSLAPEVFKPERRIPAWKDAAAMLTMSWKQRSFADQWSKELAYERIRGSDANAS